MTLYRNDATGDVFNAADHDDDLVADVKSRENWHKVTKAESEIPLAEWHPVPAAPVEVKVSSAMDDDLIQVGKLAGKVDVPQTGPTGSESNGQEAPAEDLVEPDLNPKDGKPGPVDVPQSGPTGSEAVTAPKVTDVDDNGVGVKPKPSGRRAAAK